MDLTAYTQSQTFLRLGGRCLLDDYQDKPVNAANQSKLNLTATINSGTKELRKIVECDKLDKLFGKIKTKQGLSMAKVGEMQTVLPKKAELLSKWQLGFYILKRRVKQ